MPKTYTAAGSATAGDVYTSSAHNVIVTDVNNFIVPPMVRLDKSASQSIANASDALITWPTTAAFDTDSMYSSSANDRITIQTAGVYIVTVNLCFASNATGERIVWLQKNGSSTTRFAMTRTGPNGGGETITSLSTIVNFAASDYAQIGVYQGSGGALNVLGSGTTPTSIAATWIGRTS